MELKTKFNIGDLVWIIWGRKPYNGKVERIRVMVDCNGYVNILYEVEEPNKGNPYLVLECETFHTKDEAIDPKNSIFINN